MPKAAINLYTSDASVQQFRSFTDLLGENLDRPVHLRPLSELPQPDKQGKQRLRTELVEVQAMLSEVLHQLAVGEQDPHRYAAELTLLHHDRQHYQQRLQALGAQLEEGGESDA